MLPLSIVINFDVVEENLFCLGNILKPVVMNELGLYRVKEGFCHCIVPAISFPTHALNESFPLQEFPEIRTGILDASVSMNHQPLTGMTPQNRFIEGSNR